MNIDNENNDDYFEIKKMEFNKFEKAQKAFLIRNDIILAVISIITTTAFATRGHNPFLTFAKLFTFPISLVLYGNIKMLSTLKQERARIMKESTKLDDDTLSGGKKI